MRILFGPGGSSGQGNIKGIKTVQEKGLGCYEVEFTHGVRMGDDMCQEINDIKDKIKLSTHAPYYINLLSEDKEKILASKKRILDSCNKAHKFGGDYVVFHPAFYGKIEKKDSFSLVENQINELQKSIKENKYNDL